MTRERENRAVPISDSIRRLGVAGLAVASLAAFGACDTDVAPQVTFTETGDVEGLVFFDASEDGVFDPSDGDFAIADVALAAQARGTGEDLSGGGARSGADGRFAISGLPLGTHDLLIDETTVPGGVSICQNPLQVSVRADQTAFTDVQGRPGCLITIAEAKELGSTGAFVIVRGVLTSEPGQVEARRSYIQDATAGILIFDGAFATALQGAGLGIGDVIEIGAATADFRTEFQLVGAALRDSVSGVGALAPDTVETSEIDAIDGPGNVLQGRLLRIEAAEMTVAFGDNTGSSRNARFDDGSGPTLVRVDAGVVANSGDLNTLFTLGNCYNINGFGASFDGSGELFPRSLADVEEVACN